MIWLLMKYIYFEATRTEAAYWGLPDGILGSIDLRSYGQMSTYNPGLNDGFVLVLVDRNWSPPSGLDFMRIGSGKPAELALPIKVKSELSRMIAGSIESDHLLPALLEIFLFKANVDEKNSTGPNPLSLDRRRNFTLRIGDREFKHRLDLKNRRRDYARVIEFEKKLFVRNRRAVSQGKLPQDKHLQFLDFKRKRWGLLRRQVYEIGLSDEPIQRWKDARTTITDDFQGFSAFDTMDSSADWDKVSGSGNFQALNAAGNLLMQRASSSGEAYHLHATALSGDDMYCQVDVLQRSGSQIVIKPIVRSDGDTSTLTLYFADIGSNGANDIAFRKVVSGTSTKLSSKSMAVPAVNTSYVEIDGSSYDVQVDAASEVSGTDTAIATGLYHGVGSWGNGSNSINFDNYEAADIGGGGGGGGGGGTMINRGPMRGVMRGMRG